MATKEEHKAAIIKKLETLNAGDFFYARVDSDGVLHFHDSYQGDDRAVFKITKK